MVELASQRLSAAAIRESSQSNPKRVRYTVDVHFGSLYGRERGIFTLTKRLFFNLV